MMFRQADPGETQPVDETDAFFHAAGGSVANGRVIGAGRHGPNSRKAGWWHIAAGFEIRDLHPPPPVPGGFFARAGQRYPQSTTLGKSVGYRQASRCNQAGPSCEVTKTKVKILQTSRLCARGRKRMNLRLK